MAELHESLKYLGPTAWSDVPTSAQSLDTYLIDLFSHAQTVLDSVPVPSPEDAPQPPRAQAHGQASKASEVSLSSERSAPPPFGHEKYRKEWGKPMKMKPAENPLGLSVYKMPSKDGKGSWFARHSIHEGIGYSKFKKSLQMEFEKSLAEPGPPGTGNVRGIGGEERVEQIRSDKGTVEVYRLSAQFPGPTAARDFVTMLVTSDHAMQVDKTMLKGDSHSAPRHYMVISKPCDHPQTQPRSGFVRGYYESVEFIREVPRKLKTSQSTNDLDNKTYDPRRKGHHKMDPQDLDHAGRKRAATESSSPVVASPYPDPTDPEDNPVEWMMITRSDPGGGIPRFLVERGTPSSICSDAVKFVDWACQNEDEPSEVLTPKKAIDRRPSHQSWRSRSLAGLEEFIDAQNSTAVDISEAEAEPESKVEADGQVDQQATIQQPVQEQSAFNTAAATLRPYTPQVVLDHLPASITGHEIVKNNDRGLPVDGQMPPAANQEDAKSIKSTTSFASAEDHWSSEAEEAESVSSVHSPTQTLGSKEHLQHETELQRLDSRKDALRKKFAATQQKHDEAVARQTELAQDQAAKAQEKHEREMKKHEEKYRKELAKIEKRQEKERKKMEAKMKKQADKDDKLRLTRERDEARQELGLVKKEVESLRNVIADLQKENTALVMKLGRSGVTVRSESEGTSRSRASSLSRKEKDRQPDLATASAAASMRSHKAHA